MKIALAGLILVVCTGCTVLPFSTINKTCNTLQIAFDEADLAPAWYIEAGSTLEQCGYIGSKQEGERKACFAESRNGYRDHKSCEDI